METARSLCVLYVQCGRFLFFTCDGDHRDLPLLTHAFPTVRSAELVQAASLFAACLAIGRFGAGAVMARFDWYPVLNACLVILAALIILVLPLADGLVPGAIHGWCDAPAAAFLFPLIGVVLAPVSPTIIPFMLIALPHRPHPRT